MLDSELLKLFMYCALDLFLSVKVMKLNVLGQYHVHAMKEVEDRIKLQLITCPVCLFRLREFHIYMTSLHL